MDFTLILPIDEIFTNFIKDPIIRIDTLKYLFQNFFHHDEYQFIDVKDINFLQITLKFDVFSDIAHNLKPRKQMIKSSKNNLTFTKHLIKEENEQMIENPFIDILTTTEYEYENAEIEDNRWMMFSTIVNYFNEFFGYPDHEDESFIKLQLCDIKKYLAPEDKFHNNLIKYLQTKEISSEIIDRFMNTYF